MPLELGVVEEPFATAFIIALEQFVAMYSVVLLE